MTTKAKEKETKATTTAGQKERERLLAEQFMAKARCERKRRKRQVRWKEQRER